MPCQCCATGRCCKGSTCTTPSKSQCVYESGTFTEGANCESRACIAPAGNSACQVQNPCACSAQGKTLTAATTCDCRQLTNLGYQSGGCQFYYCQRCDTATGLCVYDCPTPRVCCAGICCPISQRCQNDTCVNKCVTGTFCPGSGSNYDCCTAGEKCCGSQGCLASTSRTVTVQVPVPGSAWIDTGLTLVPGEPIRWQATGTATSTTPGFAASTPDGRPEFGFGQADAVTAACQYLSLVGQTAGVFCMGSAGDTSVGQSFQGGTLRLAANGGGQTNYSGTYSVTIIAGTDPCPGYFPAAIGPAEVFGGSQPFGPGAAMKALLAAVGITASASCPCNARAAEMDAWGSRECLRRLPEIVGWLRDQAAQRKLPFFWSLGAALVVTAVAYSALNSLWRGNSR